MENASLFGGEVRCGDDNAIEGQKRQCLGVENSQDVIERVDDFTGVWRRELNSFVMKQLELMQQVTLHVPPSSACRSWNAILRRRRDKMPSQCRGDNRGKIAVVG